MTAPLATIAFVSAAYLGWLSLRLTVKEVGGPSRILDALRGRQRR
jgi:hypothetical protein